MSYETRDTQRNREQQNRGYRPRGQWSDHVRDNFFQTSPPAYENDFETYGAQHRGSWREEQNMRDYDRYPREEHWREGDERDRSSGAYGVDVAPRDRQSQYRYRGAYTDNNYRVAPGNFDRSYAEVDYAPTSSSSRPRNVNNSRLNRQWGDASPDSAASPNPYRDSNYRQPMGATPGWQNNPAYRAEDFTGGGWVSYLDSEQDYRGRAPKGYERSDERIREDICERLAQDRYIDASDITVSVNAGVVTLEGTINDRRLKHRVEDIADACLGVKDVQNHLNVARSSSSDFHSGNRGGEGRQAKEALQ